MHNPLFSVSIGVAYKGKIVMSVVHAPFLKETYTAQLGKGAKLNNKKIKVSKIRKLQESLNTYCHAREDKYVRKALTYMRKQKLNGFDCRQLGSAAIELAFVAAGRVESIVIPGANSWDVAAGILLVREAGGRVSDFSGKKWNLKSDNMLASNGLIHKNIIDVLNNK
jgi:myo-inositol-1(or 4)-monophosphatase